MVSLPKQMLESLGISCGSDVSVTSKDGKIIILPMRQVVPGVDEDFARQLSEFIDAYRPALEALAK